MAYETWEISRGRNSIILEVWVIETNAADERLRAEHVAVLFILWRYYGVLQVTMDILRPDVNIREIVEGN